MAEAPRSERVRADPRQDALREWVKEVAERAVYRAGSPPRPGRNTNREKERFALRAQHVRTLFRSVETMAGAINKEIGRPLLAVERMLNAKNLGGIEVPDGARLVLKFLERRLEVVVNPRAPSRPPPSSVTTRPTPPVPIGTTSRCARTAAGCARPARTTAR